MALCIEVGEGAYAHGICCVAVGDGITVRGAYQVGIGEKLTIPNVTDEQIKIVIPQLKEKILVYHAICDQRVAPPEFGSMAEKAITMAIKALEQRLVNSFSTQKDDNKQ